MVPTPFDSVRDVPLRSDEQILDLVGDLVEHALHRQVWLLFLDTGQRPIPLVMPSSVPRRPRADDADRISRFVEEVADEVEAASWVFAYERRGDDTLTEVDRAWLRLARRAAAQCGIGLRGPILVHDTGVRWIADDDLIEVDQS